MRRYRYTLLLALLVVPLPTPSAWGTVAPQPTNDLAIEKVTSLISQIAEHGGPLLEVAKAQKALLMVCVSRALKIALAPEITSNQVDALIIGIARLAQGPASEIGPLLKTKLPRIAHHLKNDPEVLALLKENVENAALINHLTDRLAHSIALPSREHHGGNNHHVQPTRPSSLINQITTTIFESTRLHAVCSFAGSVKNWFMKKIGFKSSQEATADPHAVAAKALNNALHAHLTEHEAHGLLQLLKFLETNASQLQVFNRKFPSVLATFQAETSKYPSLALFSSLAREAQASYLKSSVDNPRVKNGDSAKLAA